MLLIRSKIFLTASVELISVGITVSTKYDNRILHCLLALTRKMEISDNIRSIVYANDTIVCPAMTVVSDIVKIACVTQTMVPIPQTMVFLNEKIFLTAKRFFLAVFAVRLLQPG
jgi:hypothetical protein